MYKVVEGYPNYSVSDCGQVINNKTNRILKTYAKKDGYQSVKLYHNRKNKTFLVHRLVAMAFIPNPCNYPQINHRDENTSNNCVENLEWCTGKYNCNYGGHNQRLRETLGRVQPWLGRKHSLETRLKISMVKKGFKHTEESKQKLSEKLKGRPKPKDFGEKLSRTKGFKVILDESIMFNSVAKCGLYLGTHGANIFNALAKKGGVYKGHTIRRLEEKMSFEKVSKGHTDKRCDIIAGAIVDLAYTKEENPKIAVEVLLGHWNCYVIIETGADIKKEEVEKIVHRIAGAVSTFITIVPQDKHLADNQKGTIRCGDNGIFKGVPLTDEEKKLTKLAKDIYEKYPYDGKYIIDGDRVIICHSNTLEEQLRVFSGTAEINPLGYWTGGSNVDSGATNRKLGSDMAQSVTGGGLHGKDLSKADVSVNIYAFLKAQETGKTVELSCAIGDEYVDGKPYSEIVEIARKYIQSIGGFEKFAEWGLVR